MSNGIDTLLAAPGKFSRLRKTRLFKRFNWRNSATFTPGNQTTLHPHGGIFFPALLAAIARAERQVTLEYYIIRSDTLGQRFAEALTTAVKRGVAVYLIYDYLGSFDTPASYFDNLEQNGVKLHRFNKPRFGRLFGWIDKRNHRKIAIIDETRAFLGGLNIGDEYSGFGESNDRWRDCGMDLTGPAVPELQRLFWETWKGEAATITPSVLATPQPALATGADGILIVSGGPHHHRSMIKRSYQMAITHAEQTLVVVTPYFLPGPLLVRMMLKAIQRGVRVTLILPGKSDVPILKIVGHPYLSLLLKAGVEVYERGGTVLHAKLMLVDEQWALIGSANFDQRSFHRNFEINVIVDSREFGTKVADMLRDDLAKSNPVNLEAYQLRKWYEPLLEILFAPLKRFL